ncbi:uncharacterized protein LOC133708414 [Rosa rugosa]|uniref:uncharacterized protein LOC133708414 n=1 Tax=Rosa rugosa TaxID=74645 RepID=UPI002B40E0A9|nr:uncharacterized protein LOC133708414 [Rosa rugosa]
MDQDRWWKSWGRPYQLWILPNFSPSSLLISFIKRFQLFSHPCGDFITLCGQNSINPTTSLFSLPRTSKRVLMDAFIKCKSLTLASMGAHTWFFTPHFLVLVLCPGSQILAGCHGFSLVLLEEKLMLWYLGDNAWLRAQTGWQQIGFR